MVGVVALRTFACSEKFQYANILVAPKRSSASRGYGPSSWFRYDEKAFHQRQCCLVFNAARFFKVHWTFSRELSRPDNLLSYHLHHYAYRDIHFHFQVDSTMSCLQAEIAILMQFDAGSGLRICNSISIPTHGHDWYCRIS